MLEKLNFNKKIFAEIGPISTLILKMKLAYSQIKNIYFTQNWENR